MGYIRTPRARAYTGQPKEAVMAPTPTPAASAGPGGTRAPRWSRTTVMGVVIGLLVIIVILTVALFSNLRPSSDAKEEEKEEKVVKTNYSQGLSPAGDMLPKGVAIRDGRLQCGEGFVSLILKKDGKVDAPTGDKVATEWTDDSVIIRITGKPVHGDAYVAAIFDGSNTVVSAIEPMKNDGAKVTLTANFAKKFNDSAPAAGVTLCVTKAK